MAKQKSDDTAAKDSEPSMYDTAPEAAPRRLRFVHWALAAGTLVLAFSYFVMNTDESSPEVPPPETAAEQPVAAQDVLNQELNPDAASAAQQPMADPAASAPAQGEPPPSAPTDLNAAGGAAAMPTAAEPPPPPPPAAEPPPPAMPEETLAQAEPEPPPPPAAKKSAKKAEKSKPAKKHTLVLSRTTTKIPKGLKKDKVLSYLSKKLDGDKTCIPADTKKKDLKPFTAIANFSKNGTLTAVTTQPKLAKSVSACIKKKISGNPSLFKSKSTSRLTIALKIK